jgi:hypothetical protein
LSGIVIHAVYTLQCDHCLVPAEADKTEHRTRTEAMQARRRIAEFDGWLLRRAGPIEEFLCPECASGELVGPTP